MGRAEIVLSACKNTAAAVLFCILDRMLAVPSGENIFDGMAMLFGGYLGTSGGGLLFVYGLVSNLVEPILICIMALWTVILLKNYFVAAPRERIASMRALLIYCAIVTFLVMLFKTGISYNNAKMFFSEGLIPDWFRAVRNLFLPFTFGIAGLFAVEMICLDRKKEKFSAASVKH